MHEAAVKRGSPGWEHESSAGPRLRTGQGAQRPHGCVQGPGEGRMHRQRPMGLQRGPSHAQGSTGLHLQ